MRERVHPELIWAYNLNEEKIGPVHLAFDIEIETVLQGEKGLAFSMLPNDPKIDWLGVDQLVFYKGEFWRMAERNDERNNSEIYVRFIFLPLWYDLADDVRPGAFLVSVNNPYGGLEQILEDTGWTVGEAPIDSGNYSYEATNYSVLSLIRGWSLIVDLEVYFDTEFRTVNLVPSVGQERGIGFRYGRNLDQVRRYYKAPQVTRLYPYGANELDISQVNGGIPYVENFDWYIEQGLTEEEAREKFMKQAIWEDDRYLVAINLMDAAVLKLEDLSKPTISYECTVMDLSALTGLLEDTFEIGDNVRVDDSTFGINIKTRVVRTVVRPYEPWNNLVELSYLRPGINNDLLNSVTGEGGDNSGQFRMLVDESASGTVTSSSTQICQLELTTSGNANGIIGALFVGTGNLTGTLAVQIYVDGTQVGTDAIKDFSNDDPIEIGVPTWFANLDEGNHTISLRARIIAGVSYVTFVDFSCRLYVLMQGLIGGGLAGGSNPIIRVSDEIYETHEAITEGDEGTVELTEDVEVLGLEDTLSDEHEAPTEGPEDVEIT